jgi:formylmethanofuran dehydrogenase subunit E
MMGNLLRNEIQRLIEVGNLAGSLNKAGELNGHICSYLTYGVMAGYVAMHELGVKGTGMEEVIAIVETNNCLPFLTSKLTDFTVVTLTISHSPNASCELLLVN